MSFKSDAHRKLWFANQGREGSAQSVGVAVSVSTTAFSQARAAGLSVGDSFKIAEIARFDAANKVSQDKATWDGARWAVHDEVERLRSKNG